ncbi:MAG TPA: hypothetical protein P5279_08195 [Anaerohalosphaeraceae bacterium]|nr:hypothetical protein [Anaerohalosphaeraceae bacterium]HRT50456.1 hypothetical protein [Anaerohalosphaeraceae bacterium]HRT86386.1 hypothetical protein [Anaerohalosphaeraceae bacterium]
MFKTDFELTLMTAWMIRQADDIPDVSDRWEAGAATVFSEPSTSGPDHADGQISIAAKGEAVFLKGKFQLVDRDVLACRVVGGRTFQQGCDFSHLWDAAGGR